MERLRKLNWYNIFDSAGLILVVIGAVIVVGIILLTIGSYLYSAWSELTWALQLAVLGLCTIGIGVIILKVANLFHEKK